VDAAAAHEWARLRHRLALAGRRINVNDLWIASIAVSRGLPVVTQDNDFEVLADLGGPAVIRV
jgi:predicted nucleic acid-binding protein